MSDYDPVGEAIGVMVRIFALVVILLALGLPFAIIYSMMP